MNPRKQVALFIIAMLLTACGGCGKPVMAPIPETPYTRAAKAADDIAGSIKLLIAAESNLEQQKLITPQEGLTIIKALGALNSANVKFTSDVSAAAASGSKSVAVPSGKAVVAAIAGLTGLTIKNEKARQTFAAIMATVNIALAVVENFVQ